jgi:undecaprenyl pyrophosphate phosphatase UppP
MALATALAIAVFVTLMIRRILAPQVFAVCCVVVMVIAAGTWFLWLRSAKETMKAGDMKAGDEKFTPLMPGTLKDWEINQR